MKKSCIFPVLFFFIIVLSWILFIPQKPAGYTDHVTFPSFSLKEFLNSNFQKSLENYLALNLPSLTWQLYLKNDIYELLNAGQFHSGYYGKVTQGKNGVLFEKNYLICSYNYTTEAKIEELACDTAEKLNKLQKLLNRHSIQLVLVMAPSKVDFYGNDAPWLYTIRSPEGLIGSRIAGPLFEKAMLEYKVPFVDCYPEMAAQENQDAVFTDRGIHWSMYGAAICLKILSEKLHELDPAKYEILKISGRRKTFRADYDENDIGDLLNIWPPYTKGKNYYYLADFQKTNHPNSFTFIGDSFMGALIWNMELSGYSNKKMIYGVANQIPSKKEFINNLQHSGALILVANTTKFVQPYFNIHAQTLINYLKDWKQEF